MASAESKRVLDMLRGAPRPDRDGPIEIRRATMEKFARPLAPDCTATPVVAGGVPAEWVLAPNVSDERAVLYFHGGGYVSGSLVTHRELTGRISRACEAKVLNLDYRLAPEAPFPAAIDDAVSAYEWLCAQPGLAPGGVVIGGDSAGGGLVLATLLALRDRGLPLPAGGVCISAWTDMTARGDSMRTRAALDPMVEPESLEGMAARYLAGADPRNPLASPLFADYQGLPPLLFQVGSHEVLFDDSARADAKARIAGVDSRFQAWDNVAHVWHLFAGMLPEGRDAIEAIGAFAREVTAPE